VWRIKGCAAFEAVFLDENGVTCSELLIWNADGNLYRQHITGVDLGAVRRILGGCESFRQGAGAG
jgi:hypothetical protein